MSSQLVPKSNLKQSRQEPKASYILVNRILRSYMPSPDYKIFSKVTRPLIKMDYKIFIHISEPCPKYEYCIIHQIVAIEGVIGENYLVPLLSYSPCQSHPPTLPHINPYSTSQTIYMLKEVLPWILRESTKHVHPRQRFPPQKKYFAAMKK